MKTFKYFREQAPDQESASDDTEKENSLSNQIKSKENRQRMIKKQDFDDKIDILPIADPNIFSQTQRISIAQAELQLAQSNPQMHNLYNAYRAMYEALGVKNIDMILKPVPRPIPMDPSVEAIQALAGQPFQAFKGQDHRAHITAHLNFMTSSMARNNPMVTASMQKNIFEHISLMA